MQKAASRLVLDPFCYRQFDAVNKTSQFIDYNRDSFLNHINSLYSESLLREGYAPFCKHLFIENFTNTTLQTIEITEQNKHLLQTAYQARTEKELPVLVRFFPRGSVELAKARFLDIILYSKEQIQKESEAMGSTDVHADIDYDYGIISVKPQDVDYEIPMDPITMLRNALGKEHGGSGVPLEREKYLKSVEFWSRHAAVK